MLAFRFQQRVESKRRQATQCAPIRLAMLAWLLLVAPCSTAWADGGAVRLSQQAGNYQITVFTAPAVVRAGPVDVSVLVQDARAKTCVSDAEVVVVATKRGSAETPIRREATSSAATNQLLRAAVIDLPSAGMWHVEVLVSGRHGEASVRFEIEAAEPIAAWRAAWPWFAWPFGAIAIFGAGEILRHQTRRGRPRRQA